MFYSNLKEYQSNARKCGDDHKLIKASFQTIQEDIKLKYHKKWKKKHEHLFTEVIKNLVLINSNNA